MESRTHMHALLSLYLLGTPRLVRADQTPIILRRRPRLLLFYLAAHHEALSRERLTTLLWPDYDPTAARQLLRTALHQIKLACGEVLGSDNHHVWILDTVWVDIHTISQLQAGAPLLDELAQNPPGDFLADIDTGDIDAIERWLYSERTRWQRRLAELFFQQANFYVNQKNDHRAQQIIRVAHHYEPLREDIVQLAMELAYRCADRAGAIALYEELQRSLDDQLGVPPLPSTVALYHAIVTDAYHVAPSNPQPAVQDVFVGRHAELIACNGVGWDGRVILITGDAGIGKTRLASEYLRRSNALIIHATAFDGDQHLAYHVLVTAFRAVFNNPSQQHLLHSAVVPAVWQRELRRLWPELPGGDPDALTLDNGESRLSEAIALLLRQLGQQRRIVLFCDDVQWFDDASLTTINEIIRRKLDIQWQIVITMRPGEPRPGVQRIISDTTRTQQLTRITLAPLNPDETHQLAQRIDPSYDQHTVTRAEGNPFMVIELLRHRINATPHLPDAIRDLIATRMMQLTPAAQRFIERAAICGREFDIRQCATLAAITPDDVAIVVDELQQHLFIRALDAFRARFDHPLTVESIVARLGPVRSGVLHLQFADMLVAQTPDDAAHIAHHYHMAGADNRAASYARIAAQQAHQLGAWQEAAHYMHIAINGSAASQRSELWLELGDMLSWAGNWQTAADAFQQAITHDESMTGDISDNATLGLIKTYLPQARYDEVVAVAEPLSHHPNPHIAMDAAFVCGTAHSLAGMRLDLAWEYLAHAEQLCRSLHLNDILPRLFFEQGSVLAQQGDIDGAIARYHAARQAAEQSQAHIGRTWLIFAHNNLAYHLHLKGQYGDAERHVRTGLRLAQRAGMRIVQSYLLSTSGEIALAQGDDVSAERAFQDGLDIAIHFGLPERVAGLQANLGLVARAREDIPLAVQHLSTAMHAADALGIQHLAAQIRIWLASISDKPQAHTYLTQAETIARHGGRALLLAQIAALKQTYH